jgi:hypothetical protein
MTINTATVVFKVNIHSADSQGREADSSSD